MRLARVEREGSGIEMTEQQPAAETGANAGADDTIVSTTA